MNKKLCAWIEGDGTFRTLFRKLALWDFATADRCKVQLLLAIEKEKMPVGNYGVQFAVERRKKEVQLLTHYLPLFMVFVPAVAYISMATISQVFPHYYWGLALSFSLIIVYKITWFSQYLETCRYIYIAADNLLKESATTENPREPALLPAAESIQILEPEIGTADTRSPFLSADFKMEEPVDTALDSELGSRKSNIILFVLHELVKKECNRPNIHNGPLKETVKLFSASSGCQSKNIITKAHQYRSRTTIELSTDNARTTHMRYIKNLLAYYEAVRDTQLYKQAQNLLAFITNLPI